MSATEEKRAVLGVHVRQLAGAHLLLAYEGCEADLSDLAFLESVLREGTAAAGAEVRGVARVAFEPQGASIALLLSESHASVHTYPEHGLAYLDIFTCGARCRPERFDEVARRRLRPACVGAELVRR